MNSWTASSVVILVLAMQNCRAGERISDCVAAWHFDEGIGPTVGSCTTDQPAGELLNGPLATHGPQWVKGRFGSALSFDGNDQWIRIGERYENHFWSLICGNATVCFWMRTQQIGHDDLQQAPGCFGRGEGRQEGEAWGWIDAAGHLRFTRGAGFGARSRRPVNDGKWHHIAMVNIRDRGWIKLYVDGELDSVKRSAPRSQCEYFTGFGRIEVHYRSNYFCGCLDELRVYSRELDPDEIKQLQQGVDSAAHD